MDNTALQKQAQSLILSIKGEGQANVPNLSDIADKGLMGLMANPNALLGAATELSKRYDAVVDLAETLLHLNVDLNERLIALEGANRG